MPVEVAYATPDLQVVLSIQVAAGATVRQAIDYSGVLQQFPEIDLTLAKVGIFSRIVALTEQLNPGDRVEIYRPLRLNPNQARLLRAKRAKKPN